MSVGVGSLLPWGPSVSLPARGIVAIANELTMKFATIIPEVNACVYVRLGVRG